MGLPDSTLLVRSWNVFHGNAHPPDDRSRLQTMIGLATADRPEVLCLQEVPVWALPRLERWSGMSAFWVLTRRSLPPSWLAGLVTRLHNGFFRSAIAGQANVILVDRSLEQREHGGWRIDERRREPRYCHAVRLENLVVSNLHATSDFARPAVASSEIVRAEALVSHFAGELPSVLAGDFNLRAEHLRELAGWSARGPGIDHVLVRGLAASPLAVWPRERRVHKGVVLSDHAPVEVRIG
jgi:endonuclease/exonuclease/phosphatase family metal-dependent hydrolase